MSTTIRLTADRRTKLIGFARGLVNTEEHDAKIALLRSDLDTCARLVMNDHWPMADMEVLRKYDLAQHVSVMYVSAASASNKRIVVSLLGDRIQPCTRYYSMVAYQVIELPDSHPLFELLERVKAAAEERADYVRAQVAPYQRLVESSRTLAQVLAVWPEAVGAGIGGTTALVALSDADRAKIADDMALRATGGAS